LDPSFGIIVGDPLFQALQKLVPAVVGYAVDVRPSPEVRLRMQH
jgi:hypothetical protein